MDTSAKSDITIKSLMMSHRGIVNVMFPRPVSKPDQSGVNEPKRLVKTMDFDVEKNDYSVPEFYERFSQELPQVIMISQGFFGDIVEDTFDRETIFRIQTVSKQRRVIARADMGDHSKLISIPLTYPEKVCVVKKHKLSKEKAIKEVVDHLSLPCHVQFPKDRTISVGGQNISTNHIPKLQLQKAFDEMYLLGNLIVDGVMGPEVVNIPLYLSQLRMARVTGIKNTSRQKWRGYLDELERFSSHLKYDKEYGNHGIAQYDPSAVHSDAVYSYVEPQQYSNIVSVFQHRRGNALDNHEDNEYEQIGQPRNDKSGYHRSSMATVGVGQTKAKAFTPQKSLEVKPTHESLKSTGPDQRASQPSKDRPLTERITKAPPPVAKKPHDYHRTFRRFQDVRSFLHENQCLPHRRRVIQNIKSPSTRMMFPAPLFVLSNLNSKTPLNRSKNALQNPISKETQCIRLKGLTRLINLYQQSTTVLM